MESTMTPYQRYYALHREEKIAQSSAYYYAKRQVTLDKMAEKQLEKEHQLALKQDEKEVRRAMREQQKMKKEKDKQTKIEEKKRIREEKKWMAEQTRRNASGLEKKSENKIVFCNHEVDVIYA